MLFLLSKASIPMTEVQEKEMYRYLAFPTNEAISRMISSRTFPSRAYTDNPSAFACAARYTLHYSVPNRVFPVQQPKNLRIKEGKESIGNRTKITIKKNKVAVLSKPLSDHKHVPVFLAPIGHIVHALFHHIDAESTDLSLLC